MEIGQQPLDAYSRHQIYLYLAKMVFARMIFMFSTFFVCESNTRFSFSSKQSRTILMLGCFHCPWCIISKHPSGILMGVTKPVLATQHTWTMVVSTTTAPNMDCRLIVQQCSVWIWIQWGVINWIQLLLLLILIVLQSYCSSAAWLLLAYNVYSCICAFMYLCICILRLATACVQLLTSKCMAAANERWPGSAII